MFVYTAKLSRKKLLAVLLAVAAVAALILFFALRGGGKRSAPAVRTNEDRVAYLEALGWEVEDTPLETQEVIIPETFEGVYEDYAKLQADQGFDLAKYAGMEATRYTYVVENYPDAQGQVVADLLICRNRVVAGDVQSVALDGFMQGLAFPGGS